MGQYLPLLFLAIFVHAPAQNLVPNPSFEEFSQCPPYPGQIHEAVSWDSPNNTTTDYFHACSPVEQGASVPVNLFGDQEPKEGMGYTGLRAWIPVGQNPVYREYLLAPLKEPLKAGKPYSVRFWISVAEKSTHISDGLGACFFSDSVANERIYRVTPSLRSPRGQLLTDTQNWIEVSGTYTASGGEAFLVIGNFEDDTEMLRQPFQGSIGEGEMVYYYVDAVEVLPCPGLQSLPKLGNDTTICAGDALALSPKIEGSFSWQDGSTQIPYPVTQSGIYTLQVQDSLCLLRDSIKVTLEPLPLRFPEDTTLCSGDSLVFFAGPGITFLPSLDNTPSFRWVVSAPGQYTVDILTPGCLFSDTLAVRMDTSSGPSDFQVDTAFCSGESLVLPTQDLGFAYRWTDGLGNLKRIVENPGMYRLESVGTCFSIAIAYSVQGVSEEQCLCTVFVPNAFSPNGDGRQDIWELSSPFGVQLTRFTVVDRWGHTWMKMNAQKNPWNGTHFHSGKPAPEGVYFWELSFFCPDGTKQIDRGTLLLVR